MICFVLPFKKKDCIKRGKKKKKKNARGQGKSGRQLSGI